MYGRIFRASCRASGFIPQISVILGPCAGGAVYSPAMTDFVVMTKENAHMFVTGPDVVRAVTGEEISLDDLGGAEMHNSVSGVAHYLAEDEEDALDYARSLLDYLPQNCNADQSTYSYKPSAEDIESAMGVGDIIPADPRMPYDVVDVIEALVDHGEFVEVQEHWAKSMVIGFACLEGTPVGIVADQPMHNAGTLDVESSEKTARFVRCCDAFGLPVITLVDVPGYLPGAEQERAGIIRRGAKVIYAYGNATVPMVTVITRKAYGGAYIVMGSKGIGADYAYAWPNAEIAVMGADGAVQILNRRDIKAAPEDEQAAVAKQLSDEYAAKNINPNFSVEMGELDGIVQPIDTRDTIVAALRALRTKHRGPQPVQVPLQRAPVTGSASDTPDSSSRHRSPVKDTKVTMPHTSFLSRLTAGTDHVALLFGGQATPWIPALGEIADDPALADAARDLLSATDARLAPVAAQVTAAAAGPLTLERLTAATSADAALSVPASRWHSLPCSPR
jgi:propionyl-CoA carboxylase beta chain